MTRKSAEGRVPPLMKKYFIFPHKNMDWRPGAGKSENGTDYILSAVPINLEVKQVGRDGRFQIDWFTENEIKTMTKYGGWILMEFGVKPAPKGKLAVLITWDLWLTIYQQLQENGIKSITMTRSPRGNSGADELFPEECRLVWDKNTHNWDIPQGHPFWSYLVTRLKNAAAYYEAIEKGGQNGRNNDPEVDNQSN